MWFYMAIPIGICCMVASIMYTIKRSLRITSSANDSNVVGTDSSRKESIFVYAYFIVMGIISILLCFAIRQNFDIYWAFKALFLFNIISVAAFIDAKEKIIPNPVLLTGLVLRFMLYIIGMVLYNGINLDDITSDLSGMAFGGGIFLISALLSRNSVGMGDVKMYALIGLYVGFQGTFSIVFIALLISFFWAVTMLVIKKKTRNDVFPLAPVTLLALLIQLTLTAI